MWHKIAPRLAQHFTVVAADLRGYGESSKPPTTVDHELYSKRALARDQIEVMRQLGFEEKENVVQLLCRSHKACEVKAPSHREKETKSRRTGAADVPAFRLFCQRTSPPGLVHF